MSGEEVRSYTKYPRTMNCICIPAVIEIEPNQRNRKSRYAKAPERSEVPEDELIDDELRLIIDECRFFLSPKPVRIFVSKIARESVKCIVATPDVWRIEAKRNLGLMGTISIRLSRENQ